MTVIPLRSDYGLPSPYSLAPGNSLPIAVSDYNGLFLWYSLLSSVGVGSFNLHSLWVWNADNGAAEALSGSPLLGTRGFGSTEPHMKAAGLARLQGLTGTPVCPRNYQCDHRSNPVCCVHLELAKADMRADVYWILRQVLYFSPLRTHIKLCVLKMSKLLGIFCSEG